MDDAIKNWIKQAKDAGMSDEEITQKLLADGWEEEKVSKLLNQSGYIKTEKPAKPKISFKLLVIGILLLFIGILISWPGTTVEDLGGLVFIVPGFTIILIGAFFVVGATNKTPLSVIIYFIIGVFSYFIYPSLNVILRQNTPRRDDEEVLAFVLLAFGFAIIIISIITLWRSGFFRMIFDKSKRKSNQVIKDKSYKTFYKRWWFYVILLIIVLWAAWSIAITLNDTKYSMDSGPYKCGGLVCSLNSFIFEWKCEDRGGDYFSPQYNFNGKATCGFDRYSTAGKNCNSSSECSGSCVYYGDAPIIDNFECQIYRVGGPAHSTTVEEFIK